MTQARPSHDHLAPPADTAHLDWWRDRLHHAFQRAAAQPDTFAYWFLLDRSDAEYFEAIGLGRSVDSHDNRRVCRGRRNDL